MLHWNQIWAIVSGLASLLQWMGYATLKWWWLIDYDDDDDDDDDDGDGDDDDDSVDSIVRFHLLLLVLLVLMVKLKGSKILEARVVLGAIVE